MTTVEKPALSTATIAHEKSEEKVFANEKTELVLEATIANEYYCAGLAGVGCLFAGLTGIVFFSLGAASPNGQPLPGFHNISGVSISVMKTNFIVGISSFLSAAVCCCIYIVMLFYMELNMEEEGQIDDEEDDEKKSSDQTQQVDKFDFSFRDCSVVDVDPIAYKKPTNL